MILVRDDQAALALFSGMAHLLPPSTVPAARSRATGDFSRVIELDGSFALAYFNRGLALERLGDNASAAADYRRAMALDVTQIKAQRRLVTALPQDRLHAQ